MQAYRYAPGTGNSWKKPPPGTIGPESKPAAVTVCWLTKLLLRQPTLLPVSTTARPGS